jgi:hypothetical protein
VSKNILVLTYFSFSDALIQTYTLPYVRIIRKEIPKSSSLTLFTVEKKNISMDRKERSKIKKDLAGEGIRWIYIYYEPFGIKAFAKWIAVVPYLLIYTWRNRIDFIHCWATAAGAIGFWISLFSGSRLVIDSYEPHAEAMVENGTWKRNGWAFRILFLLEKWQSQRAYAVIAATSSMREYSREKYEVSFDRFFVKPACVNLNMFSQQQKKNESLIKQLMLANKIVCVCAGKFGGIYQKQEVFEFLKVADEYWKPAFRVILLTGHSDSEISEMCKAADLDESIIIRKFVPHQEVPAYMGLADFGITPVKPTATKRHCTPIKDGEYWALGLPIVIPANISDDSSIITQHNLGAVLNSFSTEDYRNAVKKIDSLLQESPEELFIRIRSIAEKYRNFKLAEEVYHQLYN